MAEIWKVLSTEMSLPRVEVTEESNWWREGGTLVMGVVLGQYILESIITSIINPSTLIIIIKYI